MPNVQCTIIYKYIYIGFYNKIYVSRSCLNFPINVFQGRQNNQIISFGFCKKQWSFLMKSTLYYRYRYVIFTLHTIWSCRTYIDHALFVLNCDLKMRCTVYIIFFSRRVIVSFVLLTIYCHTIFGRFKCT